jgi:uncharacterized protein (TIGR02217 family)
MHIDARLPEEVELSAVRRDAEDGVEKVPLNNGQVARNIQTSQSLLAFDVSYPADMRDGTIFEAVRAAFKVARGPVHSFDFTDWTEGSEDNPVVEAPFAIADGSTTAFPLYIPYTFGSETYLRRIYRPVDPIVVEFDDSAVMAGYTVDYDRGNVIFDSPPSDGVELSWSGRFVIPVRFDTPLSSTALSTELEHIDTFTLVEELLEDEPGFS